MTHHGPDCPCCRVAQTLSDEQRLKWAALRAAWSRLSIDTPAQDIIAAAKSWKAAVIYYRSIAGIRK